MNSRRGRLPDAARAGERSPTYSSGSWPASTWSHNASTPARIPVTGGRLTPSSSWRIGRERDREGMAECASGWPRRDVPTLEPCSIPSTATGIRARRHPAQAANPPGRVGRFVASGGTVVSTGRDDPSLGWVSAARDRCRRGPRASPTSPAWPVRMSWMGTGRGRSLRAGRGRVDRCCGSRRSCPSVCRPCHHQSSHPLTGVGNEADDEQRCSLSTSSPPERRRSVRRYSAAVPRRHRRHPCRDPALILCALDAPPEPGAR